MPSVGYRSANEMVLHIKPTDSMGRTQEQIDAMEKNPVKPPRVRGADKDYADIVAVHHATYPKAMYRLALKNGKFAGDEVAPSYPMPYDLAQSCGLADKGFNRLGHHSNSVGYVQERRPYITKLVGIVRPDASIDIEASQAEEKRLLAEGWVDSVSKIEGIPKQEETDGFDPLPVKAKPGQPLKA